MFAVTDCHGVPARIRAVSLTHELTCPAGGGATNPERPTRTRVLQYGNAARGFLVLLDGGAEWPGSFPGPMARAATRRLRRSSGDACATRSMSDVDARRAADP